MNLKGIKQINNWCDYELVDAQVKADLETQKEELANGEIDEIRDEDSLREAIYQDSNLWSFWWTDFKEFLSEELARINPKEQNLRIDGEQMTWLNRSGHKIIENTGGEGLLDAVLPKTDTTIEIYKKRITRLILKVYHHDSPMGEWYEVRPTNQEIT